MLIRVDSQSAQPLFAQIAGAVRAEIIAGRVVEGERLPAARDVAEALRVNLHTVLHAYQDLRDEGLVDLRRGRGAVVTAAGGALAHLRADIDRLVRAARAAGISPDTLSALVKEAARDH
ncbi:GntR family transcriptional regulator [Microbacterium sp. EYE_5]|uniref:GntR family transcriptional regulator n=1 Tax=unclassified Microbacterium TaxID=2609290 RepID=UPI002006C2FC|nr:MULTISPECIES: GntR family transcriptional regulator [unclassified Microbacterium]MCK6081114.1 GntR family transcriptional regulator [Microbacterium sp. EYE_382]MCK6086384.1 GntR family transcriptional regulator [Microbacterium sp. EYE_384]MCK6124118.1 GntR family transcriptional regulator [Microbacterium sp. EYE_80]MCK6127027.1 GntR family transcriptional regulator [Microbacterium sp. EYE_79]MCK6142069.1 GntR family transcriptional regulator [Microbacterium sp. EYE_39]